MRERHESAATTGASRLPPAAPPARRRERVTGFSLTEREANANINVVTFLAIGPPLSRTASCPGARCHVSAIRPEVPSSPSATAGDRGAGRPLAAEPHGPCAATSGGGSAGGRRTGCRRAAEWGADG